MKSYIAYLALLFVKYFSKFLYWHELKWLDKTSFEQWQDVKVIALLNHTSLFEPLFLAPLPNHVLWDLANNAIACGADITINRPIVGLFWKYILPEMVSITRKRDATWDHFISRVQSPNSIIVIAPEGRMMRENGLDKHGKPMSIRGGIVDVLENIHHGEMVIAYSGGLHHVQKPGQFFPRIFKTLRMNMERVNIPVYKGTFAFLDSKARRKAIAQDLQSRINKNLPQAESIA